MIVLNGDGTILFYWMVMAQYDCTEWRWHNMIVLNSDGTIWLYWMVMAQYDCTERWRYNVIVLNGDRTILLYDTLKICVFSEFLQRVDC
jgi:hypothetical protein